MSHSSYLEQRQSFRKEIMGAYWKKYWVLATLKTIHRLKDLEPSVHPFFSIQRLQYVDEMSYKLQRGLKEVRYHDIYDTWEKLLREHSVYHPTWNKDDMEFVKRIISGSDVITSLLEEVLSFRTQELTFTYETLGFSHQGIDLVFDWMRTTPEERFMGGLDEVDDGVSHHDASSL